MNRRPSSMETVDSYWQNSVMPQDMLTEIDEVKSQGVRVTIGNTSDKAYDNFDCIESVFIELHNSGQEFSRYKESVDRRYRMSLGKRALFLVSPSKRFGRLKNIDRELEPYRSSLLYESINALPWHRQRGSAMALLTITSAHDLITPESSGIYPTMSGPLSSDVLDHKFDDRCDSLAGVSLHDAIVQTEVEFTGRSVNNAEGYAKHKLQKLDEFVNTPSTEGFKRIVQYCTDSLGIRSRAEEVSEVIQNHATKELSDKEELLLISFGCGTAWPIMTTMRELKEKHGVNSRVILLDQDPIALAAASQLADKMGLGDNIEMHCKKLFSRLGRPIDMSNLLRGRKVDIYEDSGLREYLPDRIYASVTRESWKHLSDNGLITTGNMNTNRPQGEFVDGLMGWVPHVEKRTIDQCLRLHRQAGIPESATQVRVTRDGVYSLYFSSPSFMR